MLSPIRILSDPILSESDGGSVTICPCCGLPILHFGDARVTLLPEQVHLMLATVREVVGAAEQPTACWGWNLRAKTRFEDVTFHLSPDETTEMADLLEGAAVAIDLDALLYDVLTDDLMG
ncbi:MAG: hypothetical protein AAGI52_09260 [Bacteroidota bacterium]